MFFGDKYKKIEAWGKKGNIEKLGKAIIDNDSTIRSAAAKALGDAKGDEPFNMLINSLRDPEATVRENAAFALGKLGDKRALEYLRHQLANDSSQTVKDSVESAIKALNSK